MEIEEKVEVLEGELKLLKGELKETLVGMRDFLLGTNLPSLTEDDLPQTGQAAQPSQLQVQSSQPSGDIHQQPSIKAEAPSPQIVEVPASSPVSEMPEEQREQEPLDEPRDEVLPEADTRQESGKEVSQDKPQVNLLANLIRWVSVAKRKIGIEQLPTLLDVYGTTGCLDPELKQVILHLAEVITEPAANRDAAGVWRQATKENLAIFLDFHSISGQLTPEVKDSILHLVDAMTEQPPDINIADVWSRLILELHGIITIDGVHAHTLKPSWIYDEKHTEQDDSEAEESTPDDKSIKLRLTLPINGGTEKEFSISLTPEDGDRELSEYSSAIKRAPK